MRYGDSDLEHLEQFAGAFHEDRRSAEFVDYCDLRIKGLRKQALMSLDAFLKTYKTWTEEHRREWAHRFMELEQAHLKNDWLIAHPLKQSLIAVFERWAVEEPDNAAPCRWLGKLTNAPEHFQEALNRDENDEYSRWRVADNVMEEAEFACHHIPDYFIGEPAEAAEWLDEAESILAPMADTELGRYAMEELTQTRQKLDDWIGFKASGGDDFNDWCRRERGYTWVPPNVVYYQE